MYHLVLRTRVPLYTRSTTTVESRNNDCKYFCAVFQRVLDPPSLRHYNRLLTVSAALVAVSEAPSYTDKDKDLADVYREEMANC